MAPAVGCGVGGPQVGVSSANAWRRTSGRRPLGPVGEAGDPELGGRPGPEAVPGGDGVGLRRVVQGDERHHVDDPDAGVDALVVPQVEPGDGRRRHRPGGPLADQGEDAPVVVGVAVDVEQVGARDRRDGRHHLGPAALADVHHALEHADEHAGRRRPTCSIRRVGGRVGAVNLGAPELLIVLVVVLVLFGGAKLPKLARSLGRGPARVRDGQRRGREGRPAPGRHPGSPVTPPAPTAAEREAELARREAELARRESETRGTDA